MVLNYTFLLAMILASTAYAGNVVFTDAFNVAGCSIPPPASDPQFKNCDVIGAKTDFDLQKASIQVSRSSTAITIYQNYRNSAVTANGLTSFNVGHLSVGASDIFFSSNGSTLYGIAMSTQNGFQAGSLYAIGNGVTARTASSALGISPSAAYFRPTRNVLLGGIAPAQSLGTGTVTAVSNGGNGVSAAEFQVRVQLGEAASRTLYDSIQANGGFLDLHMQSATCGNDVLDGRISTPEPSAFVLMGTIVAALGFSVRRRRMAATPNSEPLA